MTAPDIATESKRLSGETSRDSKLLAGVLIVCASQFVISTDITIVNVALPVIGDQLGISDVGLTWVVNAYLIALTALLPLSGRLIDLLGTRVGFVAGIAIFTMASGLCGAATEAWMLMGARMLQGIGAALASAAALAVVIASARTVRERAIFIGWFSLAGMAGASVGLLAGGAITEALSWRWIFFVNLPIGVTALVGAAMLLPSAARRVDVRIDYLGALLVSLSLALLVLGILSIETHGWTGLVPLLELGAGAIVLAFFALWQRVCRHPLFDWAAFRSRSLVLGSVVRLLLNACLLGQFFLEALVLQRLMGLDSLETGLAFMPVNVGLAIFSLALGRALLRWFNPRLVLVASILILAAGLASFLRQEVGSSFATHALPGLILLGIGGGAAMFVSMMMSISDTRPDDAGAASGLLNLMQQIGGTVGIAILASVAAAQAGHGGGDLEALAGGYRAAFVVTVVMALLAAVLACFLPNVPRVGTASRRRAKRTSSAGEIS